MAPSFKPSAKRVHLRSLVCGNVRQKPSLDCILSQLLVHAHQKLLGLGVDVTNVHAALVVEEHIVALTRGIDADVELLLLRDTVGRLDPRGI